jgi:hypothetical protein
MEENMPTLATSHLLETKTNLEKSAGTFVDREVSRGGADEILRMDSVVTVTEENVANVCTDEATAMEIKVVQDANEAHALKQGERKAANKDGMMTFIASLALVNLLFIITLQLLGLAKAVEGMQVPNLNATRCSPDFQPGAVAVIDGNCNVRMLHESSSSGIGCVPLPATQQKS